MRTIALPTGEQVPVFGLGTWNIGDARAQRAEEIATLRLGLDAAQLAEIDRLLPPPAGPQPLEML